jgi:hypothetical protein
MSLGKDVAALDGTCTNIVPSWPSDPGRARVAVMGTEPAYGEVIVVNDWGEAMPLGKDVAALDGTCTNTVPSWPSGPGRARVAVMGTGPVYNDVMVVNDWGSPLLLADGIVAPDGTCTSTVPSCPSNPGRARVAVTGTEPVYTEVMVINDCGSPDGKIPLVGRETPDCSEMPVGRTKPEGRDAPGDRETPGGRDEPGIEKPEGKTTPEGNEVPGTSTRMVVVAFGSSAFAIVVVLVNSPA